MAVQRKKALEDEMTVPLFSLNSIEGKIESDKAWRPVPAPLWLSLTGLAEFAAIDYETHYTKSYSLQNKDLQRWGYIAHPAFDAYLVSLFIFRKGKFFVWVGHPKDAPWDDVAQIAQWVSHEAVFDELVTRRLRKDGIIPARIKIPVLWDCTSDMAGYFQLDRGLERCAPHLIGEVPDKSVRTKAKAGQAGAEELRKYASDDGRQCGFIWAAHSPRWPVLERFLSREQRRAGYAGVYADTKLMMEGKLKMVKVQGDIAKKIPWANRFPVTSDKGIQLHCAKLGIAPPPSKSLDEPATIAWDKSYNRIFPFLELIRSYTKAQQIESHIDMMRSRTRKDGTVPFELIYRKAPHTARWQSGGGLRMQNLDKDEFEGFNARWFIGCPPGFKLLNADSSQIEPRVLNWIVGDRAFLDACRRGQSPYDAHAVSTMGFTPKQVNAIVERLKDIDPARYALAKARLLALGYQAGAPKFCEMARTMAMITVFETEESYSPNLNTEKDPTKWEFFKKSQIKDRLERNDLAGWAVLPAADFSVQDFRSKSPLIAGRNGIWKTTEREMERDDGRDHVVTLPNGERITYYDVKVVNSFNRDRNRMEKTLTAWVIKNSRNPKQHVETYGGKLTENRVQRIARELLAYWKAECIRKLGPFGYKYRWSVHDELNGYAPAAEAKHLLQAKLEIMSTPPPWAADLPVAAEGHLLDHYVK